MSELIAEARVLVTPDTTTFRSLLTAQVANAASGVVVPVPVAPIVTGTASTAAAAAAQRDLATSATTATAALQAQQVALAATALTQREAQLVRQGGVILASREEQALAGVAAAQIAGAEAAKRAAEQEKRLNQERRQSRKAAAEQSRQMSQLARGVGGASLAMVGLRGATLASTGPFLAGAAAFGIFAKSVGTAANLETSLNTFRVTADATATDMERIREVAQDLGADLTLPGVTANSAAEALSQLSRAGLSVQDSVDGARGTLQLATAAAIDNEQATLLVAGALNAFRLAGTDATRVADLLAASSKESQGSIVDMGLALQQSAAAAAQAGVSVEDTIALLTQLGRAGLRGSDAGTSLRVALLRLINPSKQAREAIKGLGVQIRDQAGNVRPEVFAEMTEQLGKLSRAQADATLALIFGQDAFRAAAIIGREGASGLNEMRDATQEAGAAAELASARTQGLAGAFENLKNQGSLLGLAIGDSLKGPLTDFTNFLADGVANINDFVGWLNTLGQANKDTGLSFDELVKRAQEIERLRGSDAAIAFLERLQTETGRAAQGYVNLIVEAGRINNAAAVRGGRAGEGLLEKQQELNQALRDSAPAALQAREGIEAYRDALNNAAAAAEGLRNRIDETTDRFARPLPTPTVTAGGPVPIGPTARLEGDAAVAAANEDLRELERIQEIQLENARKAFENSKGNVKQRTELYNRMKDAEAALISTRRRIAAQQASDQAKAAAEAKAAASEAERKQREADAAFLSALGSQESAQLNRVALAQQTEALADDIAQSRRLKQLYLAQRKAILARIQDVQARREAVDQVTKKIIQEEGRIKDLLKQQADAQARARQDALEEIARNLSLRTQIAEARGDEDAILAALNAEIANQRKRVALAKKAREGVLEEQLALEQLLRQRRELLRQEQDGQRSLSAFDILRQNAETFLATGGNLVTGNQPFAGPTGFTADVAQFLTRGQPAKIEVVQKAPTTEQLQRQVNEQLARLVQALEENTAAQVGGNASTVDYATITGARANAQARFYLSRQARQITEAENP